MTKRLIITLSLLLFASVALAENEVETNYSNYPGIDVAADFAGADDSLAAGIDASVEEGLQAGDVEEAAEAGLEEESQELAEEMKSPEERAEDDSLAGQIDASVEGSLAESELPEETVAGSNLTREQQINNADETTEYAGKYPPGASIPPRADLERLRSQFISNLENNNCRALYVSSKWIAGALQSRTTEEIYEFVQDLRSLEIETTCDVLGETAMMLRTLSSIIGSQLQLSKPVLNYNGQVFFDSQARSAELQAGDEIQVLFQHRSAKQSHFNYRFTNNMNMEMDYQVQQLFAQGLASHLIIVHLTVTQEMLDNGYLEILVNVSDANDDSRRLDLQAVHISF